jgi:flavin reductase (DIM6/NTAB) family NADH-FMN oxidoreductase RutF
MLIERCGQIIKRLVFGETLLSQEFFIGLRDPQAEISVWLSGLGAPLDVTRRYSMACAAPFTLCVAFDDRQKPWQKQHSLALRFCQRGFEKKVLGEIGLEFVTRISTGGFELCLFEARNSANRCLPCLRLYAHYLLHAYSGWRVADRSGMKMSFLERRAAMVNFIRPHPVVLVSACRENRGNIFPMNIMGDLGRGYFAFALKDSRKAAHLVESVGRIALSNLPMSHAPLAYQLAINHTKEFIEWDQLPFPTKTSPKFKIPVPVFSPRVREMEVDQVHRIGSHTFFVAHTVSDETYSVLPLLCVVHGFYQAWRLKGRSGELRASVAENAFGKQGVYRSAAHPISSRDAEKAQAKAPF